MKFRTVATLLCGLGLASMASATVVTFATSAELTNTFNADIFAGDSGTQYQQGYAASGGYAGSDGNFVHFNSYDTADSLQFKAGPVFLNSFTISSQYWGGGAGVYNAAVGGRDYVLQLYGASNNLLYSNTLLVGANGSWDTVALDVANVSTLRILATWSQPGVYDGWWPNLDNIRYNEPARATANAVPEPGALALVLAALGGAGVATRRRRVKAT